MVGWIPRDLPSRKAISAQFVERVKSAQRFGLSDIPILLQYDDRHGDMRPWLWPLENGIPVRPDQLDMYRHTHFFLAPCCLCPFVKRCAFSEATIGLAQIVQQPATAQCVGQYVAACPTQECGYFVELERYFGHPNLMVGEYFMREEPLKFTNPFFFTTGDTEETIKKTGLRQMQILQDESNAGVRGTNTLLRREDPERFLGLQDNLRDLLTKGLPAERFWDLFVQCTACQYVMPQQYFPYYHACVVQVTHPQLGLPRAIHPPTPPDLPSFEPDWRFDEDDLPGPASSDPALYPNAVADFCALLPYTQLRQVAPMTPKAGPSGNLPM